MITSRPWLDEWQCSFIIPILKSGTSNYVETYRPISIPPPLSLILEQILFIFLYPKLSFLLNNCPRDFRKRRSTSTQLFTFLEPLNRNADRNSSFGSIYFGFSKAFDTVAIDILRQTLYKLGLRRWFSEIVFIVFTKSSTKSESQKKRLVCKQMSVSSGVPQGSILCSLLFLI